MAKWNSKIHNAKEEGGLTLAGWQAETSAFSSNEIFKQWLLRECRAVSEREPGAVPFKRANEFNQPWEDERKIYCKAT
jgi:hypothetical protein